MIDDLCGNEFDMKGLGEFKKLLGGVQNDQRKSHTSDKIFGFY